jgi:hypothetical protein
MGFQLKCYNCKKEVHHPDYYYVTVVDYAGEVRSEEVCSEECANEIIKRNAALHYKRYENVLNQKIRKAT